MNITVSDITGKQVYTLPHVPAEIEYGSTSDNETLGTLSGKIRLVGEEGLEQVSWTGILPLYKNYSWQKLGSLVNGYDYIKFFNSMKKNKLPIRVVITDDTFNSLLNKLMSIDEFTYKKDKAKDYTYSIQLTEFPEQKWEFLNTVLQTKGYLVELANKSATRKALKKFGLL